MSKRSRRHEQEPAQPAEEQAMEQAQEAQPPAFNKTVGMAAAALTKMHTREAILDWQSATVEEIEDLVYCRSDQGTPAHGQHREDLVKALEALRAIPIPIVRIDWKKIGQGKNTRWVKEYKLKVSSMFQSYGAVYVDRETGREVYPEDPENRTKTTKGKASRRKKTRELMLAGQASSALTAFPADRYKLTRVEWRWNTDIAEDFICPQVALDEKSIPRRRLKGGRPHIEGSRFIQLNKQYFAIQKNFRDAGLTYAPRLLDYIVSEKTHITSRGKGIIWIEVELLKIVKVLGLWQEYQDHPKRVLTDRIKPAIEALIKEKVMLTGSGLMPRTDPNPDRRKGDFYRWKVAELWSTVALVSEEEAKEIETEQLTKPPAAQEITTPEITPAAQEALPGIEPAAPTIPTGAEIRAAREAAGVNLRDFARAIDKNSASHNTWAKYERGEPIRIKKITPEIWQRVRDFIAQHGTESGERKRVL